MMMDDETSISLNGHSIENGKSGPIARNGRFIIKFKKEQFDPMCKNQVKIK